MAEAQGELMVTLISVVVVEMERRCPSERWTGHGDQLGKEDARGRQVKMHN